MQCLNISTKWQHRQDSRFPVENLFDMSMRWSSLLCQLKAHMKSLSCIHVSVRTEKCLLSNHYYPMKLNCTLFVKKIPKKLYETKKEFHFIRWLQKVPVDIYITSLENCSVVDCSISLLKSFGTATYIFASIKVREGYYRKYLVKWGNVISNDF